jgi:hypothetical protein
MSDYNDDDELLQEPYDLDVPEASSVCTSGPGTMLASIWDCPKLLKFTVGEKQVWKCAWCPNETNGTRPKPFNGWNATKAIAHVMHIPGMCVRLCAGKIPDDYMEKFKDLYLPQALTKEKQSCAVDQLDAKISNLQ